MLETLLQIGKILRHSDRLYHHRYIKRAPSSDKKTTVVYFSLPVREDFILDIDNISEITDEDFIQHQLFYLTYKSSDSDSDVKYIWGDILYGVIKDKEQGYYRMENQAKKKPSSFGRGAKEAIFLKGTAIESFRVSFANNQEWIESFLKEHGAERMCFLHFAFQGQYKHWYEFEEELAAINNKLLDEFIANQKDQVVLRKSLYKTLASPEKNLPFPNFTAESMYKAKAFGSADEVLDLLYAINYSTRAMLSERDIKIIVLPKGENLTADQIEEFFERNRGEKKSNTKKAIEQGTAEKKLSAPTQFKRFDEFFDNPDSLFPRALFETGANINSFDFIFSKAGGVSAPDVDMIELAGLQKSHLRMVGEQILRVRQEVEAKRSDLIQTKKELSPMEVRRSFLNILGDVTTDKKKYQSHLLKVLPQIYADSYARDDLLLPAFIEKNEFNIRNENSNYNLLKFDYEFLTRLRKGGDEEMETMQASKSYKAGKLLGQLAQPVSWEIKSFEKNYVGLLSRRISDKQGLIAFANFINQKLAIHERAYPSLKEKFTELAALLGEISEADYHRDYCAFGFFESYFGKPDIPVKAGDAETTESQPN